MVIFLYGLDGYRLKENTDTIVGAYRKKYENSISHYCFDFTSRTCKGIDEVSNAVKSVSFFDEAKLIIVKNLFSYDGLTIINRLGELLKDLKISEDPPSHKALALPKPSAKRRSDGQGKKTVLVFVENKSESDLRKANKELFALLAGKNNLVRSFEHLSGVKLSNWVRSKFKENGHNVSLPVASLLVDTVGGESWALVNEIEKLSNYKRNGVVTEKDINLLVSRKEDGKIFDLVDAVGNRDRAKAFELMFRLTNSGQDSHYLLSMLIYHLENLLSVSDMLSRSQASGNGGLISEVIAQKCGLHPFVARKSINQAKGFSKDDLISKFNYLADLDVSSKNGLINLGDSLYNFIFL